VPVVIGGRHVATLMSGQVFRREPTQRDFLMVARMLKGERNGDWEKKARKAYFETPVITTDRFQAIVQLLNVFAQYLADYASRHAIAFSADEPNAVASAKQFVQSHVEEPITLTQVVQHVHVSRFYFCKLFKKVTGMTLTEYISRVRHRKSQDPARGSIPAHLRGRLCSRFRVHSPFQQRLQAPGRHAPTEYRATLRSPVPV